MKQEDKKPDRYFDGENILHKKESMVQGKMVSPLSICIPAYNEERNIERCLLSVLRQENALIDEILVGVNSSTDQTQQIVQEFALKRDARIRIVESNKGKAHAWNALNRIARNNLRVFLDGDCTCPPDAFGKLLEEMDGYYIVGASIERITKNKGAIVKILNFPSKYILPFVHLHGGLYLMDYEKVQEKIKEKTLRSEMPESIFDKDDMFLMLIVGKVIVSERVFVQIEPPDLKQEVSRYRRMQLGLLRFQSAFPGLYANYMKERSKYSKIYKLFYLLKKATITEKVIFPFVMIIKFFLFRYIHYKENKITLDSPLDWK